MPECVQSRGAQDILTRPDHASSLHTTQDSALGPRTAVVPCGALLDRSLLPSYQIFNLDSLACTNLFFRSATTLRQQTRPSRRAITLTSRTRMLSGWPRLCAACVGLHSSWARCCPSRTRVYCLPRYAATFSRNQKKDCIVRRYWRNSWSISSWATYCPSRTRASCLPRYTSSLSGNHKQYFKA